MIAIPEQEGNVSSETALPLTTLVKEKSVTCCAMEGDKQRISPAIIGNLLKVIG